jgi:hypothetical protein
MIYISHGLVPNWCSGRISHALFLPERAVERHLQERKQKYVSISQAISGGGDALTVDDASYGGLRLALLARQFGHQVSWFVNGGYVEHGTQYYPFQLSSMLDDTRLSHCEFEGLTWDLQTIAGRRALRLRFKQIYMRLRSQKEIEALVDKVAGCLQTDPRRFENSLSTVTPAELAQAVLAGVDLQNHSWGHVNPQVLSERERTKGALRNEEYLSEYRQAITRVFAPPFGHHVSPAPFLSHFVLLADRNLISDHCEGNLVNRRDLLPNDFAERISEDLSQNNSDRAVA